MSTSLWSTLSGPARDEAFERLREQSQSENPRDRELAVQALVGLRSEDAIRLAVKLGGDAEERVRIVAREVRKVLEDDATWFGYGDLLRLEMPPRILSLEEEEKNIRAIWLIWGMGGLLTVTALLAREHTGRMFEPLVATFCVSVLMVFLTRKMRQDPPSPGWIFVDVPKQQVMLELYEVTDAGSSRPKTSDKITQTQHPYSAVRALRVERVARATRPGDPPEYAYQLHLDMMNGDTYAVARNSSMDVVNRMAKRLGQLSGLPVG